MVSCARLLAEPAHRKVTVVPRGVEGTAVPLARLSAHVRDFRKILDDVGLIYGMFGHVDVGCLHVRPALNLREPEDERRLRQICDQVVALVKRHGGVLLGRTRQRLS